MPEAPSSWICDTCHDEILDPRKSLVIWTTDDNRQKGDFEIVHKGKCDPRGNTASMDVAEFLGTDGLSYLLSFLSYGTYRDGPTPNRIRNMDEFVDLFRRLQTPQYEEARQYFRREEVLDQFYDANEVQPYMQHALRSIVKTGRALPD